MSNTAELMEQLSNLTVVEAAELVKQLEEKWGVKAASGGGQLLVLPTEPTVAPQAKTEYDVILTGVPDAQNKIKVIKEVRVITGLGLKEAKELVDSAPKPLREGAPKDEADKLKAVIEAVGGTVELK